MYLNDKIEHTLLNPKARRVDILHLCVEARKYKFRAVCVNPEWVNECKKALRTTGIKVVQVYNFPTSNSTCLGGHEVDVLVKLRGVANNKKNKKIGKAILESIVKKLEKEGVDRSRIKVIIETRVLSPKDIVVASRILADLKIGYIKSSTGLFNRVNKRTNLDDLKLIKKGINILGFIPRKLFGLYTPKIKMAGGIGTRKDAEELITNGADVIGCSKSIKVVKE
jgi:deoxyribose-phosphate aldolase